jgi:hypothetical protein
VQWIIGGSSTEDDQVGLRALGSLADHRGGGADHHLDLGVLDVRQPGARPVDGAADEVSASVGVEGQVGQRRDGVQHHGPGPVHPGELDRRTGDRQRARAEIGRHEDAFDRHARRRGRRCTSARGARRATSADRRAISSRGGPGMRHFCANAAPRSLRGGYETCYLVSPMTRLTLYRFDDAFDRHALLSDARPLIDLLSSPDMRAFAAARALAGQLAGSATARHAEHVRRALIELRGQLARQVPQRSALG